jgi:exopolysaccharide biosynthesis polyprenyl glycosylphosphotransferase
MTRFIGNYVSRQMLALWLLELLLSFCLAYALLSTAPLAAGLEPSVANHALILAFTVGATAFAIGLYQPEVFRRTRSMLINTALGGLLAFPAAWLVSRAVGMDMDRLVGHDTFWPTKIVSVWIVAVFATRLLFLAAVRSNFFVRPVAVLGPVTAMATTVAAIRNGHRGFLEVVSGPAANAGPAGLRAAGVRDAVLPQSALTAMLAGERAGYAVEGISLETEAQFWERCLKRVDVAHMDEAWSAGLDPMRDGGLANFAHRAGDLGTSLLLLTLTLPLMLIVALLVRLESTGPVLYRQERVGLGGRSFTLLKFRSMRVDAELRGPAWATQSDPRVTRVGAFMRRTRIDELPQLLNILHGEMSFIGPRPERPHFVEQLAAVIPYYAQRARVKPGLTGWAQVNFPYGASVEDARIKLSYDLYYVKYRSTLLDIAILFSTIRVILFQEGSR